MTTKPDETTKKSKGNTKAQKPESDEKDGKKSSMETRKEIYNLSIPDDNSQVTVVWIHATKTNASLFHFIVGSISEPVQGTKGDETISTHYVFNDLLADFVAENCEDGFGDQPTKSQKESLLKNNPKFLIASHLPTFRFLSKSRDGSGDSADSDNEDGCYTIDQKYIVTPYVDGKYYIYKHGSLSMTITEPQSESYVNYLQDYTTRMSKEKVSLIESIMHFVTNCTV